MARVVGGVEIEIRGDDAHFERTMREVRSEASRTGQVMTREFRQADGAAQRLNTSIRATAASMGALALAVGVGAGLSQGIQTISGFSQAMSTLRAITQGTAAEMIALEAVAKELGSTTRFSATQAADAMTELARAGFTVTQVLAGIGPTLSAAQAGGAGIAETAAIIAATIGGFGLQATDAARIADVLAQAANGSAAGILDLGEALKFAAPTAKQLGLDLEETVAVIGKLSDGGLQGGLAGRGFQSLATQFVNERDKIEALIGTYDLATDGLGNVLARLRQAGITTKQIIEIFRAENLDTFGILSDAALNGNLAKLNTLLDDAAGSSAKAAKIMDDNLNGAILAASSAFEGLVLALADAGVEDALRDTVNGLAALFTLAAENADVLGVAIVALAARAIIPLVVTTIPAAVTALRTFVGSMILVQGAAARTALAVNFLGGPLTLAIAAAAAAYIVLGRNAAASAEQIERVRAVGERNKQILAETQGLLTGSNSPFEQIADQAGAAVGEVASLTDALGVLQKGLENIRAEGQIGTALKLGTQVAETRAVIEQLERERAAAGQRAFNAPNLGGRAGLQRNIDSALSGFDQSEAGRELLFRRQELAALENRLRLATQGLSAGDLVNQFRNGSPAAAADSAPTPPAPTAPTVTAPDLTAAQAELEALLDEADAVIAVDRANRTAGAIQRVDEFNFNRAERDRQAQEAQAAAEAFRDQIASTLSRGLEQGIRSGNWGEALRGVLAQSTSDALSDAINDLAGELVNIFKGAFSGAGNSIGSFVGSLFGGGRAGGGSVRSGMRYMVGEQGPEMFVPSVPGMIVPRFEGPASAAAGGVQGRAGITIAAPFIVQGSITEEVLPRVQAMMAAQAEQLPRIVDARVSDSLRRGRYK
jgi:TP901 family phage tail tape measure protein